MGCPQHLSYGASLRCGYTSTDSGKDVTLSGTNFQGAASDGTTLWFIDDTGDRAQAYVAATQARDSGRDISLGSGSTRGASDGTTIWFVDNTGDTAVAYNTRDINNNTSVVTGGTTYTTEGDDDGYVIPSLTGIADNAPFVITIGPQGMVDIYPQT